MSIPAHHIHIYEKPTAGNDFITRYKAYGYQHKISAIGGYDSATLNIVPRNRADSDWFASQFLGNRVAIIVDDPCNPVFEGYINRISFGAGKSAFSISLDELANSVKVKYSLSGTVTTTGGVNNTASQAVYGIKQDVIDIGYTRAAGTGAANLQSTILANKAWPRTSKIEGGDGLIHLELLGFSHTFEWEEWITSLTVATISLSSLITDATNGLLPNLLNGATFIDNTDFTSVSSNATTVGLQELMGKTVMDMMTDIQSRGDGTSYWVIGVSPTDPITLKRKLYYRQSNANIIYTTWRRDDMRIRDVYGKLVRPWTIQPDAGIRVSDWLVGGATLGDDPRETYITDISYNADDQSVSYSGDDDVTIEAAFQLKRKQPKRFGKRFGANPYVI